MSISDAPPNAPKKRQYRLGKRAEKQELTRRKIVEAAVDLHGTLGPARTSIAQIAERAGVQRHTFYAHFPDERSLVEACSGLAFERDPLPDIEGWAYFPRGKARIGHALYELYGWYARNEQLTSAVLRDSEIHEPTREIVQVRMGPILERGMEILGDGLTEDALALLAVALDFACWRVLNSSGAGSNAALLMCRAVLSAQLGGSLR